MRSSGSMRRVPSRRSGRSTPGLACPTPIRSGCSAMLRDVGYVLAKLDWMRAERIWPNGLRYLWTDAFGVVLLVSLYHQLREQRWLDEAEWVVAGGGDRGDEGADRRAVPRSHDHAGPRHRDDVVDGAFLPRGGVGAGAAAAVSGDVGTDVDRSAGRVLPRAVPAGRLLRVHELRRFDRPAIRRCDGGARGETERVLRDVPLGR